MNCPRCRHDNPPQGEMAMRFWLEKAETEMKELP